jgi:exopolysaccharide biosynthesis polyprenyl glycosylphosphotransferase
VSGTLESHLTFELDDRTRDLVERRRSGSVNRRGWLIRRAFLIADLLGLLIAFGIAQLIAGGPATPSDRVGSQGELLLFLLTLPGWVVVAKLNGLYVRDEERADHSTSDDFVGVFHLITVGVWLFAVLAWLTDLAHPQLSKLVVFWLLAIASVTAGRALARSFCRRQDSYLQNTIIVGAGEVGRRIAQKIRRHPEYGLNLVGLVDAPQAETGKSIGGVPLLGHRADLPSLVEHFDLERVIVAEPDEHSDEMLTLVRGLRSRVQVDLVPPYFQLVGPSTAIHTVEGLSMLGLPPQRLPRSSMFLKRAMDVLVSAVALTLLAPLLAVIAAAIKLDSPGPALFRQTRTGVRGHPFRILKFRTMIVGADARKGEVAHLNVHLQEGGDPRMFKIDNDPRVTRIGRFLRKYCLDELPQLWNVLIGQMSLVGPRPLIPEEDREVLAWSRRRLEVKPGMTGLWQTLGSSQIAFSEMMDLDYFYVTSWSLWGDCRLLLRTLPAVLRGTVEGR